MKSKLFLVLILLLSFGIESQNLHNDFNAASIQNETNATAGWTGGSVITSDGTESQNGIYSLKIERSPTNGRNAQYSFSAVIGEQYTITIWAKQGTQVNQPAFAGWTGVQGFSVTSINSTVWTEFTWVVTATNTSPIIKVFTGRANNSSPGDHIFIDSVSIIPASGGGDTEVPSTITTLTASNTTSTTTELSWTASTDNIGVTNYEVFQDGVSIGLTGGTTAFNVTGLSAITNYDFTVFARDAAGNISVIGNTENVITLGGPDINILGNGVSILNDDLAPSIIDDTDFGQTDITSGSTIKTFTIQNLGGSDLILGSNVIIVGSSDFTVASQANSTITAGNSSTFDITFNPSSEGIFLATILISSNDENENPYLIGIQGEGIISPPDTEAPSAITDLTSTGVTGNSTTLSWTASVDNIGVTDYEVFQGFTSIGLTEGLTTFNVTNLGFFGFGVGSLSYKFTVYARDAAGNISLVSNSSVVTTPFGGVGPPLPPSIFTPENLIAQNTTETTVQLTWEHPSAFIHITDYEVLQDGVSIGITEGATTFSVTGLLSGTSYAFSIASIDALGNLMYGVSVTDPLNITTDGVPDTQAPSAITDLTSSGTTSTSTSLSWTASTDNIAVTDYEVFQDGVSIGFTGGATAMNVTGLTASTSYAFTVFARDAVPNISTVSNTENVITLDPGSTIDYTSDNANLTTVDWTARDLFADRNIGIGTTNTQGYRLAVAGNVVAEEIKVALQANWPDYVFKDNYNLPSLKEVEVHINKYGHLINIPSAKEVEKSGIILGDMNGKLLRKIEELVLYKIAQQKRIEKLEAEKLELKKLQERLLRIEKQLKDKK